MAHRFPAYCADTIIASHAFILFNLRCLPLLFCRSFYFKYKRVFHFKRPVINSLYPPNIFCKLLFSHFAHVRKVCFCCLKSCSNSCLIFVYKSRRQFFSSHKRRNICFKLVKEFIINSFNVIFKVILKP